MPPSRSSSNSKRSGSQHTVTRKKSSGRGKRRARSFPKVCPDCGEAISYSNFARHRRERCNGSAVSEEVDGDDEQSKFKCETCHRGYTRLCSLVRHHRSAGHGAGITMSSVNDVNFSSDSDTYVDSSPSPSPSSSVIKLPPAESDDAIDTIDEHDQPPPADVFPPVDLGAYSANLSAADPLTTSVAQSIPLGFTTQQASDAPDEKYWPDQRSSYIDPQWYGYDHTLYPSIETLTPAQNVVFSGYESDFGTLGDDGLQPTTTHLHGQLGLESDVSMPSFPPSISSNWHHSTAFTKENFNYP